MHKSQNRQTVLFAAGGFTGLLGIAVLALGLGAQNLAFGASNTPSVTQTSVAQPASTTSQLVEAVDVSTATPVVATPAATADSMNMLDQAITQNNQLRQALALMVQRDAEYRQQLEQANQTILSMQGQPDTGVVFEQAIDSPAAAGAEEPAQVWSEQEDNHEYAADEHEADEYSENHDEHESGEHDDD